MLGAVTTMPTPINDLLNSCVIYTGVTDANYTTNTVYRCDSNGSGGYTWTEVQFATEITIDTQVTSESTNPVTSEGIANFVNSSINALAAYYITYDAQGSPFPTRSALMNATTFYYNGAVRTPTQNDYCIVLADENYSNMSTRYMFNGTNWVYQYTFNMQFTTAQLNALNSGITSSKVSTYDGYASQIAGKMPSMTVDSAPTSGSSNLVSSGGVYTGLSTKADANSLATVATSGSYDDLTNKPTIPTIPNLSKGTTTGTGNVVSDISVSGHTITLTKGVTALTEHQSLANYVTKTGSEALTNKTYNGYTLGAACAKAVGSVASGNTGLVTGGDVYTAVNGKQNKNATFTNVTASSWASDNTYSDYFYKGTIALSGVTSSDVAWVTFGVEQATSGEYAPICDTYNGGVYIWSQSNTSITIPSIVVFKG